MQSMANAVAVHLQLFPRTATSLPSACPASLASRKSARRRAVPCRAAGGDFRLDRRDLLAGLTGVAAGGLGAYPNLAYAAGTENGEAPTTPAVVCDKVTVTDELLKCDPSGGSPCQPSPSAAAVKFTPPTGPMRVRWPAHNGDEILMEKYKKALQKMKDLPATDPRSFASQAAIHEAYCDGHYQLRRDGDSDAPFDVHFSWFFAPWHRMYIYFYERILGSLIDDETFALPYWNWDAPAGMTLPAMFKDECSPLYDAKRNPDHLDDYVVLNYKAPPTNDLNPDELKFNLKDVQDKNYNKIVKDNLATMHNQMIRQGLRETEGFLGKRFCRETGVGMNTGTSGTLESSAHTGIHIWLGDGTICTDVKTRQGCGQDMGFLGTAARDPLFYSHHANVDRLWHIWATDRVRKGDNECLQGKNFEDTEWLDTSFTFYDEKLQLVRVTVGDFLDAEKLGYRYSDDKFETQPWKDCRPELRTGAASGTTNLFVSLFSVPADPIPGFPLSLKEGDNKKLLSVPRPAKEDGKQQVLVFDGIEFNPREVAKFDVAVNVAPEVAGDVRPQCIEYAGSFSSLPRGGHEGETKLLVSVELPLDNVLDDVIGDDGDKAVNVVIVPRTKGITIKSSPRIESKSVLIGDESYML